MMKYSAFLFDFDFTLADASDGIVESANYALGKLGFAPKERDEIRKTVGMTLREEFAVFTGCHDDDLAGQFVGFFKEKADEVMTEKTVFLPDALEVLRRLKARGVKTGIVTSKLRYRIVDAFAKYGEPDLVSLIIGFGDVADAKPSPMGLLKAIEMLGVSKESVLYVGDSLIDAKAATNAGVDFAAVTTGTTSRLDFEAEPHVFIGGSLTEILDGLE